MLARWLAQTVLFEEQLRSKTRLYYINDCLLAYI